MAQGHPIWSQRDAVGGSGGQARLFEAVEDLALHAVLDLASPQHQLQDFVDGVFRVFLRDGMGQPAGQNNRDGLPQGTPPAPQNFSLSFLRGSLGILTVVLRGYPWLCIQELLLAGSGIA